YLPAFERGMAEQLEEVEAIAGSSAPPTFENTIAALARSGRILDRTPTRFSSAPASTTPDGIPETEQQTPPPPTRHSDPTRLARRLWQRIKQVTTDAPEESWLLEKYRQDFIRAGADLSEPEQQRLRELNEELSRLSTEFAQSLLKATTE